MPFGCCKQQFTLPDSRRGIDAKGKAVKLANMFAIDEHLIFRVDMNRHQRVILAALAHQHRCPPVDEALAQCIVQRVRQFFFQMPRALRHGWRVFDPVRTDARHRTMCGPPRSLRRNRIDIALDGIQPCKLASNIAVRQECRPSPYVPTNPATKRL
jgi:hypothetical protein